VIDPEERGAIDVRYAPRVEAAPVTRGEGSPRAARTRWDRLVYALVAVGGGAVLALARLVEPAGAGFGTHLRLGLPPCTFHLLTGHPCPGCGLTTSFCLMARGRAAEAFLANAMGPLLFALVALLVPISAFLAVRPVRLESLAGSQLAIVGTVALVAAMIVVWLVRLVAGLA
jgi:hypothetical protein